MASPQTAVRRPFPGMRPFEVRESRLFFGQEAHVSALLQRLGDNRLMAVLGESGCGKSSLVKAGLISRLQRGPGASLWRVVISRPGHAPINNLAEQLAAAGLTDLSGGAAAKALRSSSWGLVDLLEHAGLAPGHRVLIVIDQFEEIFRYYKQAEGDDARRDEADLFIKLLLALRERSRKPAPIPVYAVLTMRSEYLGDAALFFGLAEALNDGAFLLPKMTRSQIEAGIEGPLALFGASIDNELLQRLLNETEEAHQDGLPLLQNALLRIWESAANRPGERRLRLEDFIPPAPAASRGPAPEIDSFAAEEPKKDDLLIAWHLNQTLDRLYEDCGEQKPIVKRLFSQLGEYDHKGVLVRRSCSLRDASLACGVENEALLEIAKKFRDEEEGHTFLTPPLSRNQSLLEGKEDLDIAHEALLRRWTTLRRWVREEARNADEFRGLADKANRRAGPLAGAEIYRLLAWRKRFAPTAEWARRYQTAQEDYSRAMRYLDRSRTRFLLRAGGLGALVMAAAALAVMTMRVDALIRNAGPDPIDRMVKARQALGVFPWGLARAEQAVWNAYQLPRPVYWTVANPRLPVSAVATHEEAVAFAAGSRLRIWRDEASHPSYTAACEAPGCFDLREPVRSLAYGNVAEQEVLAVGGDTEITLIYPRSGARPSFPAFPGGTTAIALSPKGTRLVAAGADKNIQEHSGVRLYDTSSRALIASFGAKEHAEDVIAAVFQDETRLFTAGRDGSVISWNIGDPPGTIRHSAPSQLNIGPLTGIAYKKPKLAVCGSGRDVAILNAETLEALKVLTGDEDFIRPVHRIAFSADGALLAAATADAVRFFDMGTLQPLLTIPALHGTVLSMAFEERETVVAVGTSEGALEIFPPAKGEPESDASAEHGKEPEDTGTVAISQAGDWIAAGVGRYLEIWRVNGNGKLQWADAKHLEAGEIQGFSFPKGVYRVAFLPGNQIAAGLSDGTIHVFAIEAGKLRQVGEPSAGEKSVVLALAASSKPNRLASGTLDGLIRIHLLQNDGKWRPGAKWRHDPVNTEPTYLRRAVRDVQFSRGGALASAGYDGKIRVWTVDGALVCSLESHQSPVRSIAFSSSGRWLVSGSEDFSALLWDLGECKNGAVLQAHSRLNTYSDFVQGVGFSEETLWSLSKNGRVTVYDLDREGKPREKETHDLITPGAFKLSVSNTRAVISTTSNDIYTYPVSARGVASLTRRLFPDETVKTHGALPSHKENANGSELVRNLRATIIPCSYKPEVAKRILSQLTSIVRNNPSLDIDSIVWNDLCFWGSSTKQRPDPLVMPACYAAVSTNPGYWNVRSSLAYALLRRGESAAALKEYALARLSRGFMASKEIRDEFDSLSKRRGAPAAESPQFETFIAGVQKACRQ
jgi:WD40 repeat protein